MLGKVQVASGQMVSRAIIEATVTRADGTIEHLGIIADSDPLSGRPGFFKRLRSKLWPN